MTHTIALKIHVADELQEFLIAELSDLDFDVFEQEDGFMNAYIPAPRWTDVKREQIEQWLRSHGLMVPVEENEVTAQNWNKQWEETIQPLAVGPFLIKPTWAEMPEEHADKTLLEIDPKMSFGTGYHESTRLALRFLPNLVDKGDFVLDAGCGTGILAIAATKLGATKAIAFDIDPWAQANAVENLYLNNVADAIAFREGDISVVPEAHFDLILANINRGVLLDLLPAFAKKLKPDGHLVLAGLLLEDRNGMLDVAARHCLAFVREAEEGAWWSVVLRLTR
jgi:ribosomal protein L11 methyltransferase